MKKLPLFLALLSLAILFIFSCKKEKNDVPSVDYGSSNGLRTTVTGIVLDESNAPLTGVTVTAYGQTTSTNQYGTFVLKNINVNKDRCVVHFSKTKFYKRAHGFIASPNTVNYVRIVLISSAPIMSFSALTGAIVTLGSAIAEFQPNSLVTANGSAYSGTVNISIKHLSPGDVNFGFSIPGGDLLGKNVNNEDVALYSYGMLGVELTGSSGETLQLATGTSATLTLSIAASQLATAPATIPLWFFDETTSLWKEEGSAAKIGNNYVGTVAHFSWWNCDISSSSPLIKGKVVDCNGIPVPNIVVTVNGWATTLTNQNGEWQGNVPSGMVLTAQVLAINNGVLVMDSQLENISMLSNNQTFIVPDLMIACPTRVAGMIKTCSGENTDGIVFLTNNAGFNTYQYIYDGYFNIPSIENAQLEMNAYNNSNGSEMLNITTLSTSMTLNVGDVFLCDSLNLSGNNFILDGGPFLNQLFNINVISANTQFTDTIGGIRTNISITGTSVPNFYFLTHYLSINDTIPTLLTGCYINLTMTDSINNYNIQSSWLECNLTEVGTIGNKIKGSYYGTVITNVNGSTTSGYISGNFDVIRTQ